MTKITRFDESSIESLRLMLSYGIDKEEAIKNACEIRQITPEFIREFKEYITSESFSKSYMLSMDMINAYPELFDKNMWAEGKHIDIALLFDPSFYALYGHSLTSEDLTVIDRCLMTDITREQMEMYFFTAAESTKLVLLSHAIDNLSDDDIVNTISTNKCCLKSSSLSKRMTGDMANKIIENSTDITLTFVLTMYLRTKDISLVKQIISSPEKLSIDTETNNKLWQQICEYLPEDILTQVIALGEKYCTNAINYSTLAYCLRFKEFEEDDLMSIADSFKRNNLVKALCSYARARDYENLICLLVLST